MIRAAIGAAVVGLVFVATASAQQPPVIVNVNFAQPYVPPAVPPVAPTLAESGYVTLPIDMSMPPPNILNRAKLACYTNQNSPGCSSLRNELRFIFGSCRTFFNEPCLPHPNSTGRVLRDIRGNVIGIQNCGSCNP